MKEIERLSENVVQHFGRLSNAVSLGVRAVWQKSKKAWQNYQKKKSKRSLLKAVEQGNSGVGSKKQSPLRKYNLRYEEIKPKWRGKR